eukprot:1140791-Rhodomonas_salina.1
MAVGGAEPDDGGDVLFCLSVSVSGSGAGSGSVRLAHCLRVSHASALCSVVRERERNATPCCALSAGLRCQVLCCQQGFAMPSGVMW